jgi:hypothetical protein
MQSDDPIDATGVGVSLGSFIQQWYTKPTAAPTYGFNGKKVVILAHSFGGLVARSMMVNYFQGHLGSDNVAMLVTFATPHHGSPGANIYDGADYYVSPINALAWFVQIPTGMTHDMEWDCYDQNSLLGCRPGIPSGPDYSKIIAYGAVYSPLLLGTGEFDVLGSVLCAPVGYCANDGIVPLGSALFENA